MSTDRETTRIVRSWLEDGVTRIPDSVLDAVLDQLPATHQRRVTWWPVRRLFHMNKALTFGIAAVAVVLVAFLGLSVLAPAGPNIGGPDEIADTTPSPTPSPTSPPPALPERADLDPGTYRLSNAGYTPRAFTVTVPAGWHAEDGFISKGDGIGLTPDVIRDLTLSSWIPSHVFEDACLRPEGDDAGLVETDTPDEMVQAIAAQGGHETTGPTVATLGGYPAQRLEFAFSADYDVAACDDRFLRLWPDPGPDLGGGLAAYVGQSFTLYVVDVDGEAVIVAASVMEDSSAAEVAELESIVDSIEFEPAAP